VTLPHPRDLAALNKVTARNQFATLRRGAAAAWPFGEKPEGRIHPAKSTLKAIRWQAAWVSP